jgi:hypothetical protein
MAAQLAAPAYLRLETILIVVRMCCDPGKFGSRGSPWRIASVGFS